MIGKVKLKDGNLVLIDKHGETPVSPNNPVRFQNLLNNRLVTEDHCWVDYTIETIAIGDSEFDVTDSDVAIIEKVYDETFGTDKENVSVATERYSKNKYPIGGFAPGFYTNRCVTCQNYFVGDKRAVQCEICALESEMNQ
jgi:hypothetical protein